MTMDQTGFFNGRKIQILELFLKNTDNQLEVSLFVRSNNDFFRITFFNVSRFRVGELMVPVEVHGLEIINHSQKGWEKDFKYEIRDFEDDLICFFCESFMVEG